MVSEIITFAGAGVLLVERRGRRDPLDPKRQIEIRTLLDSMPEMVAIIDTQEKIVDANESASRMLGIHREELIGRRVTDLARKLDVAPRSNLVQFQKPLTARALTGETISAEHRAYRHPLSGAMMELLVSANPIRNENGEIQGAMLIGRDITELTHLQQRIADIERHQAIGHVAAGIAHDFNNTLQTISQAVSVLQLAPDRKPEERKVFLNMIQNAVQRGAEVISRIRDHLRTGTSTSCELDTRKLMEDAIELTRPLWQTSRVALEREFQEVSKVRGNAADLVRVFTNLIINAVQAMPNGGNLYLGCEDRGRDVHAWVRDTGSGIPAEAQKRIFDPYFTTKAGGTGLGLSGAHKILVDLGGKITFQSAMGNGTQFDVYLPKSGENRAAWNGSGAA